METRTERIKKMPPSIWPYIKTIAAAVILALVLRYLVVFAVAVEGPSMESTLQTGNIVLVEKVSYYFNPPSRMDIVIVEYPNREGYYVKRVIGLAGETVEVKEGRVLIDGKMLSDPQNEEGMVRDMDAVTVPPGSVFVMGDNRNHSLDSRDDSVGCIPLSAVKGRGVLLIWPLDKLKTLE